MQLPSALHIFRCFGFKTCNFTVRISLSQLSLVSCPDEAGSSKAVKTIKRHSDNVSDQLVNTVDYLVAEQSEEQNRARSRANILHSSGDQKREKL